MIMWRWLVNDGVLAGLIVAAVAAAAAAVWKLVLPRVRRAGWQWRSPVVRIDPAELAATAAAGAEAGQLVEQARVDAGAGAWVAAAERYEQASARHADAGDARGAEVTRWDAARAYRRADRHDQAAALLADVVAACIQRHDRPGERQALADLAEAYLAAGRPAEAGAVAATLAGLAAEANATAEWEAALRLQVDAATAAQQWGTARTVLEVLLEHALQTDYYQVALYKELSRVCAHTGDTDASDRYHREAWELELRGNLGRGMGF
jgi:tetratricopeptide (TPR) repeat protein